MSIKQVDPPKWPSGDYQFVAVLSHEPEDIEGDHHIRFTPGVDDLGEYTEAAIELPSGRVLVLNRHKTHPNPGIEVMADADDDPSEALAELKAELGATDVQITWVNR